MRNSRGLERKCISIMLFIFGIRSCLSVFQLYSFSSSAFAIFFFWNTPLGFVSVSFEYYLWSNAAAKMKRKFGESLVASFYSVWKSKKELAGSEVKNKLVVTQSKHGQTRSKVRKVIKTTNHSNFRNAIFIHVAGSSSWINILFSIILNSSLWMLPHIFYEPYSSRSACYAGLCLLF